MPPAISYLASRFVPTEVVTGRQAFGLALLAVPNLAALAIMATTEVDLVAKAVFLLFWGVLLFVWVAVLRRPAVAAFLTLAMIVVLILLSWLKYETLLMTVNFVDVMIVDTDTIGFLLKIYPGMRQTVTIALIAAIPLLVVLWRTDPFRIRRQSAAAGGTVCLAGIVGLSLALPIEPHEGFYGENYVSKFARSGVAAFSELMTHGLMESDAATADRLKMPAAIACQAAGKRPHIVMIFDESSFDIRAVPGVKVPRGYGRHFRSFDGKARSFLVEGAGGPSWYTEYNVLTGLSALSYGRFAYFVTRIAAGRVERGLPNALRRCGYRTFTFYPTPGAFMSARRFQTTTGIEKFVDGRALGAREVEPDSFFYDAAARTLARERGDDPLFMFVYLAANHFPWDFRYRPDLLPNWRDLGNEPRVEEYLRRQAMSARDYTAFVERLKRDYPTESFMLVRFGDHQPEFAAELIEPGLKAADVARRVLAFDPRYFNTYYAIDAINFTPADTTSALDTLDAPYLPLVVLEAAGLSLDPSFAEQKKILQRCYGKFYRCRDGAEARRFNRLLIDAGLIKGL